MKSRPHPLLAASIAALVLGSGARSQALPGDPFVGASPQLDARPPDASDHDDGDWGVAGQTGAATYTVPIVVPPGRHGMQPGLGLRYSSAGALRGGVAAGWSLELPSIELDRSSLSASALRYTASLGGSSGRLVATGETPFVAGATAYRLELDDGFVRFEYLTTGRPGWVAVTTDGVRHYFDEVTGAFDAQRRWMLTEEVDRWGNSVKYTWTAVDGGRQLSTIDYGANAAAGLAAHAQVELVYWADGACPGATTPIGATVEWDRPRAGLAGKGRHVNSPRRLTSIRTRVKNTPSSSLRMVRAYDLLYDTAARSCSQATAPLRYLTSIAVTGYDAAGATTAAPPISFEYNRQRRLFDTTGSASFVNPTEAGNQFGASYGLVDLDGDGIRDQAWSIVGSDGKCAINWQRGLRGGGYTSGRATTWSMPSASWAGGTLPNAQERCTFTGQITYKRNTIATTCPNKGSTVGYRFLDWDRDGLDDLVVTVWHDGFYNPYTDVPLNGGVIPLDNDGGGGPPPPDSQCDNERTAEISGTSRTVLRVHLNQGTGFASVPWRIYNYSPAAVPPPGSDGALRASQLPAHSIPVLTDLNGDGYQDIIDTNSAFVLGMSGWSVYLGSTDALGGLPATSTYWPLPSFTVADSGTGKTLSGTNALLWMSTAATLRDVNGDGLANLVIQHKGTRTFTFPPGSSTRTIGDSAIVAFLNTGDGFASEPMPMASAGALELSQTNVYQYDGTLNVVDTGAQGSRRRLVDVDGDGLVDQLLMSGSTSNPNDGNVWSVAFGTGDSFGPSQSITPPSSTGRHAQRFMTVVSRSWRVWSDFTDVNGDGVADLAEWTSSGVVWRTETAAPMRLLSRVRNGRGAVVDFSYVPSTDRTVVAWASNARLPGARWIARQISVSPGSAQPTMWTRYSYAEPTYGSPTGRPSDPSRFLGFREVTSETAGGARSVTRYTYAVAGAGPIVKDAHGRAESVESWSWDAAQSRYELLRYATTSWQAEAVLAGKSAFVHRTSSYEYTCGADTTSLTMPVCTAAVAEARRTVETWTAIACQSGSACLFGSPTLLWVRTGVEEGKGTSTGVDSRRTLKTYEIRVGKSPYATADYRILPLTVERQGWVGSAWQPVGRAESTYDSTGNVVTEKRLLAGTTYATTTHTYDVTGNRISSRRPMQQPSGPTASMTYDAHKLVAVTATNELGHTARTSYDLGTGERTRWDGPNTGCGGACGEHEIFKVDGLGRARERWVGLGASFTSTLVEKISYTDGIPSKMKTEQLVDVGGTAWVTAEREVDGLGRPVLETRPVPGKPAAVSRWRYDAGGGLAALDTPDPRVDTGATVTSTFTRDGAGRPLTFRRPDGGGLNFAYDGRREIRRDQTVDGSGGEIVYRVDVFGRIVEVRQGDFGAATASTLYAFDAADRLTQVTDADGKVTSMAHDPGGRRTAITRGTRTWVVTYDAEDRVTALRAPMPVGGLAVEHTSTMTYDVIGRLLVRTPARRGKGDAELAALGVGPVVHAYDTAANGKGRVASITAQRFGGGAFVAVTSFAYEARGLVASEYQQVITTSPIAVSASSLTSRSYNALGQAIEVDLQDGGRLRRVHDATGAVVQVERWTGSAWQMLATYNRGVAGAPRTRSGPGGQVRTFGYDSAGRVLTDVVAAGATTRATMTYDYFDDGNLERVSGTTGGLAVFGDYAYDALGQVTFAQGPNGRYQAFEYSPSGNITGVSGNETGFDRSFDYAYAGADPQAVTGIVDVATSATHASYVYDAAGNATGRTTPGGAYTLTWDGEDVLRASDGPGGREVYLYDGAGGRVASVRADGARVWIGDQELQIAPGGAVTKRYTQVSDGGQVIARIENGSTIELQYADMLQNLALALDTGGNVTAAFSYGPFGDVVASLGEATHRRQFNGKEHDAATGLRYYGARYYDPVARRWMSADPLFRLTPDMDLGQPLSQNLYAFCRNNPVRYYDPDGRHWTDFLDGSYSYEVQGSKDSLVVLQGSFSVGVKYDILEGEASFDLTLDGSVTLGNKSGEWRSDDLMEGPGTVVLVARGSLTGKGTVHLSLDSKPVADVGVEGKLTIGIEVSGCAGDFQCIKAGVDFGVNIQGSYELGGKAKVKGGGIDPWIELYKPDGTSWRGHIGEMLLVLRDREVLEAVKDIVRAFPGMEDAEFASDIKKKADEVENLD